MNPLSVSPVVVYEKAMILSQTMEDKWSEEEQKNFFSKNIFESKTKKCSLFEIFHAWSSEVRTRRASWNVDHNFRKHTRNCEMWQRASRASSHSTEFPSHTKILKILLCWNNLFSSLRPHESEKKLICEKLKYKIEGGKFYVFKIVCWSQTPHYACLVCDDTFSISECHYHSIRW